MLLKTVGCTGADMLDFSLSYCQEKMRSRNVLNLLMKNDRDALEYFRYGLAIQAGAYLGESSAAVKEVYLYPDTEDEEPALTLPLTLIIRVEKYTAALETAVEELQRILLREYRKIFSPLADDLSVLLHAYFLKEVDYFLFRPPLRVWSCRK